MSYFSPPTEYAKDAGDAFEKALIEDTTPLREDADRSVINSADVSNDGKISTHPLIIRPVCLPEVKNLPDMPLQNWKGPLRGRLNRQVADVRKRLENPRAVILVIRGTNYSAQSVKDVFWLYMQSNPEQNPTLWSRLKKWILRMVW